MKSHNHPPKCPNYKSKKDNFFIRDNIIKRVHKWDSRLADKTLKFCTSCKRVWETIKSKTPRVEYYTDFPSLGKQRLLCDNCFKNKGCSY